MISNIKWVYNYLNYKPAIGIISAGYSYAMALQVQTLESIKFISAVAGCIVACLTAVSWIIKACTWVYNLVNYLKHK
jgi:hypothetical protein